MSGKKYTLRLEGVVLPTTSAPLVRAIKARMLVRVSPGGKAPSYVHPLVQARGVGSHRSNTLSKSKST